ncbi:carboxylesterase/lipase family protein [Euzebyella saccharophila]|uniref:Carboxylic ester hydrolase n=1 Tax=Euzebyella saccharophila TaxID=679664 RepID=A0ABV8JSH5_9FLAO|nr:carboxylesterase family protein [Euzebyella saccharophila]
MKSMLPVLIVLFIACTKPETPKTIVTTDKGMVEGYKNADGSILIFKGIPFAAPPVSNLRWKAPQPASSWEGVKKTVEFGPSPIQNPPKPFYCWTEEFIAQPEPLSEDCLYLNVWSGVQEVVEKQPVFVWIYGGGLSSGSANCAIYDGEEMAKKGVVFVSLNYRVGALGFMAHEELSSEADSGTSGNYGFLDQIAALEWVQKNIDQFGGDPNNITIAGQSAGAYSVHTLISSPLAKGLFHKAILQSGGLFNGSLQKGMEEAEQQGKSFMDLAGVNSIAELRGLPTEKVLELSNQGSIGRFGVTRDGFVLPRDIHKATASGNFNQVPIMAGWVTGDGSFMGEFDQTVEDYRKEADSLYGKEAPVFLDLFPVAAEEDVKKQKAKLTMLRFAGMTPHILAGYNAKPTYVYEFAHVPPDKPNFPNYGAFHTSEVPFALHTLHTWERPWRPEDRDIEDMMATYWTNFAKTGDPNGLGVPVWQSYKKAAGNVLRISDATQMQKEYVKAELDFLKNHITF